MDVSCRNTLWVQLDKKPSQIVSQANIRESQYSMSAIR